MSQPKKEFKKPFRHTHPKKKSNFTPTKGNESQCPISDESKEGKDDRWYIRLPNDFWIADILSEYEYKVSKGRPNLASTSPIPISNSTMMEVSSQFVRDVLRCKALKLKAESVNVRNEIIFNLLRFVLRDKAYQELMYVPLVPTQSNEFAAFGTQTYYLAARSDIKILPKVGPITIIIEDELPVDLKEDEFKRLAKDVYFKRNLPIPIIKFGWNITYELKSLNDINLPILRTEKCPKQGQSGLLNDLNKLGILFTDFKIDNHQVFVKEFNPANIVRAVEQLRLTRQTSMEKLFQFISNDERDRIREYIVRKWKRLIDKRNEYEDRVESDSELWNILREFPIWPTFDPEVGYVPAVRGMLVPEKLEYYESTRSNYRCYINYKDESERRILKALGVYTIADYVYLGDIFDKANSGGIDPSDLSYNKLLRSFLKLPTNKIDVRWSNRKLIPNQLYSRLLRADECLNQSVLLIRRLYAGSDLFIADDLTNGIYLSGLEKLGFEGRIDVERLIRIAKNIETMAERLNPPQDILDRAEQLILHFYYNIDNFAFSFNQWDRFKRIKIVPSRKLCFPYFGTAKIPNIKLCAFSELRMPIHIDLCWTQAGIFHDRAIPPRTVLILYEELEKVPAFETLNHLLEIKKRIENRELEDWREPLRKKQLRKLIRGVYARLNEELILSKEIGTLAYNEFLRNLNKGLSDCPKVFFNGKDPFDLNQWKAAKNLVFNVKDDLTNNLVSVHSKLKQFKNLLLQCGAKSFKLPSLSISNPTSVAAVVQIQNRDPVFENLCKLLDPPSKDPRVRDQRESEEELLDTVFHIRGQEVKTSRFVLAFSCPHFYKAVTSKFKESNMKEIIHIKLQEGAADDVHPDSFRVFLKWLYKKPLEEAMNEIPYNPSINDGDEADEISFYLNHYIDLLNLANLYFLDDLKELVADTIVSKHLQTPQNIIEIRAWAKLFSVDKLINYCEKALITLQSIFE
ncbi:11782_t:CDS:2 [Diversispora eburnea]|uniref:11782_t:CDS:1 n=1 Tax=Diversispora eburnea TaxID=1213867 RepID=A0A9N8ZR80_9GLOM|nr:11782_t:CDS:2 [Diversispora eburnea]